MDTLDGGAESESSMTSTQPSLGRPYTLASLPYDSGDANADANPLRNDSTDSSQSSLSSKETSSIHQLETPEVTVHRAPMILLAWSNSPVTDSLASSIVVGGRN
jgi:hypothetical protein